MATITLVHGTSGNRAEDILKYGFDCAELVWNCSASEHTYFFQVDKYAKAECLEDEDLEEQIRRAISTANEQGQIAAAIEEEPRNYTVVFEITINCDSNEELEKYLSHIYPDDSCPNMEGLGAVYVENETVNKWLRSDKVSIKIHKFEFLPKLALAYLTGVAENKYFQETLCSLSEIERNMLNALTKTNFFLEDLFWPEEIDCYEVNF